jgi:FkbM family methyltransferase
MIERILKPHYLFRPRQGARRLLQGIFPSPPGPVLLTLPWGLSIEVDTREDIGRSIRRLGLYDLAVSETLWRLLAPGDLAVDVGANIGYMTSLLALRAGPAGRVLAFEPHPQVFRHLTANVRRFEGKSTAAVETYPSALGERTGSSFLDCGECFASNQGTARITDRESPLPVEMTTLDQVLQGRTAALVKIDVEGGEAQVLKGAAGSLREGRIENLVYEAYAPERAGLAGLLTGYGYRVFALGRDLRGLILSAPSGAPRLPGFEAPNFLATRDPDSVLARLAPRGWRVLNAVSK